MIKTQLPGFKPKDDEKLTMEQSKVSFDKAITQVHQDKEDKFIQDLRSAKVQKLIEDVNNTAKATYMSYKPDPGFKPYADPKAEYTPAIVDNSTVASGVKAIDFGYQIAHCDDASDGELVLVDGYGNVQLVEQADELSDDYKAKVVEFKKGYEDARHQFKVYRDYQDILKDGYSLMNSNPDDTHQVNSTLDVLVDIVANTADNVSNWFGLNKDGMKSKGIDWTPSFDAVQELAMRSIGGQKVFDKVLEEKFGKDWVEKFSGSTEGLEALEYVDVSDTMRAYMAYKIANPDDDSSEWFHNLVFTTNGQSQDDYEGMARFLNNTFTNVGDTLDWGANLVKAVASHTGLTNYDTSDESVLDSIKAGYAPTWSETGRRAYAYDTGNGVMDFVLEVISDPDTIVSFGASTAGKVGSKGIAKDLGKEFAEDFADNAGAQSVRATVKRGLREGMSNTDIAARIASRASVENQEAVAKLVTDALDYSKAINISRSLRKADEVIDKIDTVATLTTPIGPAILGVRGFMRGKNIVDNAVHIKQMGDVTDEQIDKLVKDALAETTSGTSGELNVFNAKDFVDTLNKDVLGNNMSDSGVSLEFINKDLRDNIIVGSNNVTCLNIENGLLQLKRLDKVTDETVSDVFKNCTNGRCASMEEFYNSIQDLVAKNDITDTSMLTRLEKLREIYERTTTEIVRSNLDKGLEQFKIFKDNYYKVFKETKYVAPNYDKLKTFRGFAATFPESRLGYEDYSMFFREVNGNSLTDDELYKMYLTYADDYKTRRFNAYHDTNEAIKLHNKQMQDIQYQIYSNNLTVKIRNVMESFENKFDIFTDSADDVVNKARLHEILEQPSSQIKDWSEAFDIIERTISNRHVEAYEKMHIGTASMPISEPILASRELLHKSKQASAQLKSTGLIDDMAKYEDLMTVQGKVYQAKMNSADIANVLVSNERINTYYTSIVNADELGGLITSYARTQYHDMLGTACRSLVDEAYSAQRYVRITDAIRNATDIPPELRQPLIDKLFANNSTVNRLFNPRRVLNEYYSLDTANVKSKSRMLAKKLKDDSLNLISRSNAELADMFKDMKCCELDTLSNVRNIEKVYNDMHIVDPNRYQIFISVRMYKEPNAPMHGHGGVQEISMRSAYGEVTLTNNALSDFTKQQADFYTEFGEYVDALKKQASLEHKNIQFVGFNMSSCGYDTANELSEQLRSLRKPISLYDIQDVADYIRVQKGLPVIGDAAVDELTHIINTEMLQWISDVRATGVETLSPSIIPKAYTQTASSFSALMPTKLYNTSNEAYVLFSYLNNIKAELGNVGHEIKTFNHEVAAAGLIHTYDTNSIMPLLNDLEINKDHMALAISTLYDDKVVGRYFDIANSAPEHASELFEFARNCDYVLTSIQDYNLVYSFSDEINNLFEKLPSYCTSYDKFLQTNGMVFKQELTVPEKYAVILSAKKTMNYKDSIVFERIGTSGDKFGYIINFPYNYVFTTKHANLETNLKGVAVDETSILNKQNAYLAKCEEMEQGIARISSSIEAHESVLRQEGMNDSLTYIRNKTKQSLTSAMHNFIESSRKRIIEDNRKLRTKSDKALNRVDGIVSRREMLNKHSGGYDNFVKHITDASKRRDVQRFAYIASQDSEALLHHLIGECGGRMVIDAESVDASVLNTMLSTLQTINRVNISQSDSFIKVWYDITGLTDKEIDDLIVAHRGFQLDAIRSGHSSLDYITSRIAEHSPASITYGMFDLTTPERVHYFDSKFFKNENANTFSTAALQHMGLFDGKYNCMYHGDISKLTVDNIYLSNDMFTNLCNAYGRAMNSIDNETDMLRYAFSEANSFNKFVATLNRVDSIAGRKPIAEAIENNGYTVCGLTVDKRGGLKIVPINVHTSNGFNYAMHSKRVACMRYDTYRSLQDIVQHRNVATGTAKTSCKALQLYRNYVRQPFIMSFLNTKYATWVRNAIDSPLKATFKEGPEHFSYIFEAFKVKHAYEDTSLAIAQEFGKINPDTIAEYFAKHTELAMSKNQFLDLLSYWKNPLSGTMAEEALRLFDADPTYLLKKYSNVGMTKEDYNKVFEVFKKHFDTDETAARKMSNIHAELTEMFDSDVAAQMVRSYLEIERKYKDAGAVQNLLEKIPFVNAHKELLDRFNFIKWNANRFNDIETYNRLAIYLKHLDEGDNPGQALMAIAETQFDYSKSDFMRAVEDVAPFTTFKLYNIQYWFDSVWKYHNDEVIGDVMQALIPEQDDDAPYWSEENMNYRAMINAYIDTLEDESDFNNDYDAIRDYTGTKAEVALPNGWITIGDQLYFKSGASLIDALTFTQLPSNPADAASDHLFAPLWNLTKLVAQLPITQNIINSEQAEDVTVAQYVKDHEYELANLLPVIGSLYYSLYSTARNYSAASRDGVFTPQELLTVLSPSLFARQKDKNNYAGYEASYYARPVGFDWYNQSDAYKQTHRYVMGMSYIPAWVSKDPASYIDTWGRLQQMGLEDDTIQAIFNQGGAWWFTKDGDGYSLHNYNLMVHNEDTWNRIYDTLIKSGWSEEKTLELMNKAAVPMWKQGNYDYTKSTGYGKYSRMNKGAISYAATSAAKRNMAKYSGNYKSSGITKKDRYPITRAQYDSQRMARRGHNTNDYRNTLHANYKWHERYSNIYKDNYAKYGASRMAMRQNLRNYSNRSVTELHRTEGAQRYTQMRLRRTQW